MNQEMSIRQTEVAVDAEDARLEGTFNLPANPIGIVVFAHGSGSSRFSPRNRFVAGVLNDAGFGTLLFDLLTPDEQQVDQRSGHLRFDIRLLARRLIGVVDWLRQSEAVLGLSIGLFGASTGAAAALVAAAERPSVVCAVVSRGGRPDLAGETLREVKAPTLLIVGGKDTVVIGLNREASHSLGAPCRLEIVPNASHLFQEPGTLEEVAQLARDWFQQHLPMLA
jgi:putative phosphoribosyl transferase